MNDPLRAAFQKARLDAATARSGQERAAEQRALSVDALAAKAAEALVGVLGGYESLATGPAVKVERLADDTHSDRPVVANRDVTVDVSGADFSVSARVRVSWVNDGSAGGGRGEATPVRFTVKNLSTHGRTWTFNSEVNAALLTAGDFVLSRDAVQTRLIEAMQYIA
jgi:hypothetical protein